MDVIPPDQITMEWRRLLSTNRAPIRIHTSRPTQIRRHAQSAPAGRPAPTLQDYCHRRRSVELSPTIGLPLRRESPVWPMRPQKLSIAGPSTTALSRALSSHSCRQRSPRKHALSLKRSLRTMSCSQPSRRPSVVGGSNPARLSPPAYERPLVTGSGPQADTLHALPRNLSISQKLSPWHRCTKDSDRWRSTQGPWELRKKSGR